MRLAFSGNWQALLLGGNRVEEVVVSSKTCFVVGPIGDDDSDDRIHADWLLEMIISPVFKAHFQDYILIRADKIAVPGRIDAQVINNLIEADLVIADLSTLNANAFYEIGIRHAVQKPIIHMHINGQRIPFDIASFRSIKFSLKKPRDIELAITALIAAVTIAISPDHVVDTPVAFVRGQAEIMRSAPPADQIMNNQLNSILERLTSLESTTLEPYNTPSSMYGTIHRRVGQSYEPSIHFKFDSHGNLSNEILNDAIANILNKYVSKWNSSSNGYNSGILSFDSSSISPANLMKIRKELIDSGIIYNVEIV